MDTSTPIDPTAVQLSSKQPYFLSKLPSELRLCIYEHIFSHRDRRTSISQALSPLLSCRDFYAEARSFAWSLTDFPLDWDRIVKQYIRGWDYSRRPGPNDMVIDRDILEELLDMGSPVLPHVLSNCGLTPFCQGALRRVTLPLSLNIHETKWMTGHFLRDIRRVLEKNHQLDIFSLAVPAFNLETRLANQCHIETSAAVVGFIWRSYNLMITKRFRVIMPAIEGNYPITDHNGNANGRAPEFYVRFYSHLLNSIRTRIEAPENIGAHRYLAPEQVEKMYCLPYRGNDNRYGLEFVLKGLKPYDKD